MIKFKEGLEILQRENTTGIIISEKTLRWLKHVEAMKKIVKFFGRKRRWESQIPLHQWRKY